MDGVGVGGLRVRGGGWVVRGAPCDNQARKEGRDRVRWGMRAPTLIPNPKSQSGCVLQRGDTGEGFGGKGVEGLGVRVQGSGFRVCVQVGKR